MANQISDLPLLGVGQALSPALVPVACDRPPKAERPRGVAVWGGLVWCGPS